MDNKLFLGNVAHHSENGERKYPNGHRDVKRKLSFINKKIGDFQHQRKFLYKNSAKVKRIIHNQVNQIVKCLRARERSLWADVDEAYIAQDEYISEELSMLQSVHARCESLFEHFDHNKGIDALDKIYSTLSQAKFGEKQDVKALEFISDFETMKSMANCFGHLEGDFVKKDEFVFINKRETNSPDQVCQEFHDKNGSFEKLLPVTIVETENFKNEYSSSTESEDTFEIVDLLDTMCCEDTVKDSVMAEQENSGNQEECVEYSLGSKSKFLKISNGLENSQNALSKDFNPEEEWKQIFEMKNRIANFNGMSLKISEENKNCESLSTVTNYLNTAKSHDKNCKQNTYSTLKEDGSLMYDKSCRKEKLNDKNYKQNKILLLKEGDSLAHNRSSEKATLNERKSEINSDSTPAELVRQAFSSYFRKESIHNWLLRN